MSGSTIEIAVLVAILIAIVFFAASPLRHFVRRRREQEYIANVSPDDVTEIVAPPDVSRGLLPKRLQAAGLAGPPEVYLFAASTLAAVVGVLLLRLLPAFPLAGLIGGAMTVYLSWTMLRERVRRRARRLERQLIDAIDLTAGTLQAGGSLPQALRSAASSAQQPLRAEFDEAFRGMGMGMPLERAFQRMAERYDSDGIRLFAVTLAAKTRVGGDLVPVLKAVNETLRDSWRQQRQVYAQLAGARLTALGVVVLPYVLALMLGRLQPRWFDALFNAPVGPTLLFMAVMLQLAGILWLWRILGREF